MSTEPPRRPRAIEITVDIDTTLEEAWQALTTGEGIARESPTPNGHRESGAVKVVSSVEARYTDGAIPLS